MARDLMAAAELADRWTPLADESSTSTDTRQATAARHRIHAVAGRVGLQGKADRSYKRRQVGGMVDYTKGQLTLAVIEDLKSKGMSQSQIARLFGKTRQADTTVFPGHGFRIPRVA